MICRALVPTSFLVLWALAHGPMHVGGMQRCLIEATGGMERLCDGKIAWSMPRLLEDGLIVELARAGRVRIYAITAAGAASLAETQALLQIYAAAPRPPSPPPRRRRLRRKKIRPPISRAAE